MFGIFGIATVVALVFGTGWLANDVAHNGVGVYVPPVIESK